MSGAPESPATDDRYLHGGVLFGTVTLLALANFMAILDIAIVNVTVPHIAGSLAVSPSESTWVITSYAVAEGVTVPLAGWLAARFGAVRVFVAAVTAFGACSLACGLAPTLPILLVFRVLQGLSGGPLLPMSQTLLMHVTPPRRVQIALGIQAMTSIVAPVAGPLLGGMITDALGWPWTFYINIPISIVSAMLVWILLKSRETIRVKQPVDYVGLGLLIVWIGAAQILLDKGQDEDWFSSPYIVTLAIIAGVGFVAFLMWELTDPHPIVDLAVFRNRSFCVLAATMALIFGPFFAVLVLVSLWLQTNMGYTATWAGYVIGIQGILGIVASPVVALLISRLDPRLLLSGGISLLAGVTLWRITFDQSVTFWQLAVPQFLTGLSLAMFAVPLMGLPLVVVPSSQTASAAGLMNFTRTMAGAFGTALGITIWERMTIKARVGLTNNLHGAEVVGGKLGALGFSPQQSLQTLDGLVQSQAVMIATNELFLVLALVFAVVAAGVWLAPKPTSPVTLGISGH